jgi:hypothetical protein
LAVQKTGILVFKINDLPFSGGVIGVNGGGGMSLFGAFLFSEKSFCQNRDIKWPTLAQYGPKMHNYLCACPFLEHSCFENKYFTYFGTSN